MAMNRPIRSLAIGVLLVMTSLALSGCPARGSRVPARTAPVQTQPVQSTPPPPPPPPPVPTEAELAAQSARGADARGDHGAAIELYRRAAALTRDWEKLADLHYTIAVLEADPNNAMRDLVASRDDLMRFTQEAPGHPRTREARVIGSLIDEAAQVRAESTAVKTELEAMKLEVASLKAKLEEKEKELAGIKKVLLQNNSKP